MGTSSSDSNFYCVCVDFREFYFCGERAIFLNFGFDSYTIGIFTSSDTSFSATFPENYDMRFSSVKYSLNGYTSILTVATFLAFLREGGG